MFQPKSTSYAQKFLEKVPTIAQTKEIIENWKGQSSAKQNIDVGIPRFSERTEAARKSIDREKSTVVYLSYENPLGKNGGVEAVARMAPDALERSGEKIIRLSPLHAKLGTAPKKNELERICACLVPFAGQGNYEVTVYEWVNPKNRSEKWYLMGCENFFLADDTSDPYLYKGEDRAQQNSAQSKLLRDALFASRAVPEVLKALRLKSNVICHIQDWQFASVALTGKEAICDGRLESLTVLQTSHNPYDHYMTEENVSWISPRTAKAACWEAINGQPRDTVYSRMIPLTDGPMSTVSRTFALELTTDPLQLRHFATHLQAIFEYQGIVGIDNGVFNDLSKTNFKQQMIDQARNGNLDAILRKKLELRREMLRVLSEYKDPKVFGELWGNSPGDSLAKLNDNVPVFLMFGRFDLGQKGFDVFIRAIQNMPPGMGRYVLTPIVPSGDDQFSKDALLDLQILSEARKGEVLVFPFRMTKGYGELMAGATWSVWPSMYEPCGALSEPYIAGTPVVGRAAGGILQQIRDIQDDPQHSTGILYRETLALGNFGNGEEFERQQWSKIQATPISLERMENPLYNAQIASLGVALMQASAIYMYQNDVYGRILSNLNDMAAVLSWEKSVELYRAWYNQSVK